MQPGPAQLPRVLSTPLAQVASDMKRYREVMDAEKALDTEKRELRDRITSYMREGGAQVAGLEAGGYRASIAYRTYYGFNEASGGPVVDDGRDDHTISPVSPEQRIARLASMKRFFARYFADGYIPAGEKIAKAVEAAQASSPRFAADLEKGRLPEWLKKSDTPILRVSGSGVQ